MSKTERRKFFQPIPLSSILDPTYQQTPFSKLEKFQLDMDISPIHTRSRPHHHHHQFNKPQEPSVWKKIQTTIFNTMSNLVMSQPVFASGGCRSSAMPLTPWKSYKNCEMPSSPSSSCDGPKSHVSKPAASLFHSVRTALEVLRYFATHPLNEEKGKLKEIDCKPSLNIIDQVSLNYNHCNSAASPVPVVVGCGGGGSASSLFPLSFLHFDSSLTSCCCSPQVPAPSLFSLAMTGFLPVSPHHMNMNYVFYNSSCILSPMHVKGAAMLIEAELCSSTMSSPSKSPNNFEIFIHSTTSTSRPTQESAVASSSSSSTGCHMNSVPNNTPKSSPSKENNINPGGPGCIRIETNWRSRSNSGSNDDNRTNFHSVSVCSASAAKGGTLTFSCSSTMSSSPRAMGPSCGGITVSGAGGGGRRRKTESESSTDSFVEFSASVESTDSFCIVFESAGGGCIDENMEDDDDDWEDDEDDDEDESEDEDRVYNYNGGEDLYEDGAMFQTDLADWNQTSVSATNGTDQVDGSALQVPKKSKRKTVSFDEDHLVCRIEFEDDEESKEGRDTYWEACARDRVRFHDRILRTGDILESILLPDHRAKVFSQRFATEQIAQ